MRYYENPEKTGENRLKPRSWYVPAGAAERNLLNGPWNFAFFEDGDRVGEVEEWDSIEVPSCWQRKGVEHPNYTNVPYPYPCDPPYVPMLNPMGVYERTFEIPAGDLCHYFVFEGVSSFAELFINGQRVGYTQGSHLMAEFDITSFVTPGQNRVQVRVRKWCCGSYLEDQDAFRYNGIFRDVYVLSRPKGHLTDLDFRTEGDDILLTVDVPCSVSVYDGETLLSQQEVEAGTSRIPVENPTLWNAEKPYLYTLRLEACGEIITRRVGFRTIALSAENELLINGVPVKLKGVNHHDTHPEKGWCMSEEDLRRDLELMKTYNMNAVRTSHYPPSPVFLDLCDEMGFYVVLENDMEAHGFLVDCAPNKDKRTCNDPIWQKELVERMRRTYERDKVHPSIIMWSLGNESDHGENHRAMSEFLWSRDSQRLVHYEGASVADGEGQTDVYSRMYPTMEQIDTWAKTGEKKQPIFLCEYCHAMGNGPGSIWDYWEIIYAHKSIIGGCIWEWADHVVLENGSPRYGGDFPGELTHDGNFCCDGMVFHDRSPKPGSEEIRNTYAPFRIRWEDGRIVVKNCFDFTSFRGYTFQVDFTRDGESFETLSLTPDTLPGEEFSASPKALPEACRYGCHVRVVMKNGDGRELGCLQEALPVPVKAEAIQSAPLSLKEEGLDVVAEGAGFRYVFSKQLGGFTSIQIGGKEQLLAPTHLSFYRAATDNDVHEMQQKWACANSTQGENLDRVSTHVYDAKVEANRLTLTASAAGVSRSPIFRYTLELAFYEDGQVKIDLKGQVRENAIWLPRLGFEFKLPYEQSAFRYFGNGPWDSYADMSHHGWIGWHESDADREYVPYARPQEHGNHVAVKRLEMADSLWFQADETMEIAVLHHSIHQLEKANHTDELIPSDGTHVRVDYKVSGIGSNSCGWLPAPKYQLCEKEVSFGFTMGFGK